MMTPARIVRLVGIAGLLGWLGMVSWMAKTTWAQNGAQAPQPPPAPPAPTPSGQNWRRPAPRRPSLPRTPRHLPPSSSPNPQTLLLRPFPPMVLQHRALP